MAYIVNCKAQDSAFWSRTATLNNYFEDIRNYPLLTYKEERKLLEKTKSANKFVAEQARNRLVECNQRFVVSIARKFQNSYNLLDLVEEANVGLIKAIENYDLKKSYKLITYAVHWMRKYINDYLMTKEYMISSATLNKVRNYVPKINNKFLQEHQRYPTNEELKDLLLSEYGIKIGKAIDLNVPSIASVDELYSDYDEIGKKNIDLVKYEQSTSSNDVNEHISRIDIPDSVNMILSTLPDRDREIIKMWFGIDREFNETRLSIANKFGITCERVKQIVDESLTKLKKNHKFNKINDKLKTNR